MSMRSSRNTDSKLIDLNQWAIILERYRKKMILLNLIWTILKKVFVELILLQVLKTMWISMRNLKNMNNSSSIIIWISMIIRFSSKVQWWVKWIVRSNWLIIIIIISKSRSVVLSIVLSSMN